MSFIVDAEQHETMKLWKMAVSRGEFKPIPKNLREKLLEAISKYFTGFDFMTVPAPSFHTYEHYPIWWLAQQLAPIINLPLVNLFPHKSGKTKMINFGSIDKQIQDITCDSGKFILILDDLYTTGHTMRVTSEAIARKGSFPCGIAIA